MKKLLSILGCLLPTAYCLLPTVHAQTAYEHTSSSGIYNFLDEMTTEKHILLNTAIKPYSRTLIAEKLKELTTKTDKLNKRQQAELTFYLREFYIELQSPSIEGEGAGGEVYPLKPYHQKNGHTLSILPPIYAFSSKPFSLSFRPYGGGQGYTNSKATLYNSYFGGSVFMYGWKNLAIYANYRDAHQSQQVLALPTYITQSLGANYKLNEGDRRGGDFSEMRGGLTYTYKWFNIGIVKDHIQWGNNYNGSNIFSGRTPSFAMLKMQAKPTKWFELNYFHGWLVSEVIDSARTYNPGGGQTRTIFRDKYIAANFITIGPVKGVALSLGNSIVYSDVSVQPAYFIPFLFYKSIDHTLNHGIDNQNSQVFFDLSIRSLKHVHIYSSLFIDEFSVTRIADKDRYNFYSIKGGLKVTNWPLKNIAYTVEYTQSNPLTYKHRVTSLTFESNQFNLGHYLSDNSREIHASASYKPLRTFSIAIAYNQALKGVEHPYISSPGTPFVADKFPLLDTITWQNQQISLNITYEFAYNCKVDLTYTHSNTMSNSANNQTPDYYLQRYSPAFLQGKNNTLMLGLHFGF